MKSYSAEAVVLRLRPLGEADRIVILFSRERGKIDAVARGARRPRSKFGGRLDFFTRVNVMLHAGKSLDTITGVETVRAIWEQLVDPDAFVAASYVAEVVDALCELDLAVPELYEALCDFQIALAQASDINTLLAIMDFKMLAALGFSPELDACARCGAVLGRRPLSSGRAWLSAQAGGLLCKACVRSVREGSAESSVDLLTISAADFARLRSLPDAPLSSASGGGDWKIAPVARGSALHRITRAFVEHQMGRRSKVHSVAATRTRLKAHKT